MREKNRAAARLPLLITCHHTPLFQKNFSRNCIVACNFSRCIAISEGSVNIGTKKNVVIDTDKFLELPVYTRLLYYELSMRADDDGFIGSPKKITRMIGASVEDLQRLVDEEYLIQFDSGVVAVRHWKQHNLIRGDRYRRTVFLDEFSKLQNSNNIYTLSEQDNMTTTTATTAATTLEPQDRIGKDRVSEERTEEAEVKLNAPSADGCSAAAAVLSLFDSVCKSLPKAGGLTENRQLQLARAESALGEVGWEDYFRRVEASDFLSGRSGKWQGCSFDWLLRPDTIAKVLSGQYDNRGSPAPQSPQRSYCLEDLEEINTLDFVDW